MTTSLSILGVTGTIGQNCLKVLAANPGMFSVAAVTANDNAEALAHAARISGASFAAIANPDKYSELKQHLSGSGITLAAGEEGLLEAANVPSDVVLAAIVGMAGLKPTLKAMERGARIALANKECLVSAGALFMQHAKRFASEIIPVDSEHNAIFQILEHCVLSGDGIEKITLTASGGPFRRHSLAQLQGVTPAQAVAHPNWRMGAKISVDSATMANKGLELIEAMHLFDMPTSKLAVLVHPESIIHALVTMRDGAVLAQMSVPDMCVPIAHALGFPQRIHSSAQPLDLARLGTLTFEAADEQRFPALALARQAMLAGGAAPCVFNAANEMAVAAFLDNRLSFMKIPEIIENALQNSKNMYINSLHDVIACDAEIRKTLGDVCAPIL